MPGSNDKISLLIIKYLQDNLSPEEQEALQHWLEEAEENRLKFNELTNWETLSAKVEQFYKISSEQQEGWAKIVKAGLQGKSSRSVYFKKWWPYVAAACVAAGIVAYFLFRNLPVKQDGVISYQSIDEDTLVKNNQLVLTIVPGWRQLFDLENIPDGYLTQLGGTTLEKKDTQLICIPAPGIQATSSGVSYARLSTKRGSQYQLILPDKSHVWLNASSSVRFPVAFTANERIIHLTGESLFDVAKIKDRKIPFKVKANGVEVEALGTRFNVMAYKEEETINVTLLQGSVKVTVLSKVMQLRPGEQAIVQKKAESIAKDTSDINDELAWKEHQFQFYNETIETIMHQLERWYNIEVKYKSKSLNHFSLEGSFSRDLPLDEVLKILEGTGEVHFTQEGNTVTVSR